MSPASDNRLPHKLYRAVMRNGALLTVTARNEVEASDRAFSNYHTATGNWAGVETVELAEGYDVA